MAEATVSQEELITGFMEIFRKKGYEGASLGTLAEASGLRKSSLYHRFPGGKQQMATEVLNFTRQWVSVNITNILRETGDPNFRLAKVLDNINFLYSGGKSACILKALSMDTGLDLFTRPIKAVFEDWIHSFTILAQDFGFDAGGAKLIAEDILIKVQGSLIVANGLGDQTIFNRTLQDIENSLKENQ